MKEFKVQGYIDRFGVGSKDYQAILNIAKWATAHGINRTETPVEVIIRIPDQRQEWIDKWYADARAAEDECEIFIRHCKQSTFICLYCCGRDVELASAAPRHGDKYDYKTGIAVAYAKLLGRPIPDYI